MVAASRDLVREINQFHILNAIRIAGAISRVEIARITGQSRATVTNITARLIVENLIYEKETEDRSRRGRKRVLLALNPDAAYVVGVKLSAYRISCAVTDIQADVKSSVNMPVRTSERPVKFVADLIEEGIRHCIAEARIDLSQVSGIGLGIPGFVDSRSGVCFWTPLYQKGDVPLKDLIQKRFQIETLIENDTNTVTLAHQWFGEGKGIDNFLVVTIEDGVGMGIVVNGQLYRGARGIAAEFGHVVVDPNGRDCRCGKKGCIEAYASNFSILDEAQAAIDKGEWHHERVPDLRFEEVVTAAQSGERILQNIFTNAGTFLGMGLAGLIQIFNPSKIIISGEGVRAGNLMFQSLRRTIRLHTNPALYDASEIVIQKWRDTDWARGAASLVLQELYKSPFNRVRPII
ncbi:MAG: ROK family transcriptional regulator [Desulfobacterales bacterium]|nr:ROK family transcriptional regulator [Desulfobacterales bacterium]